MPSSKSQTTPTKPSHCLFHYRKMFCYILCTWIPAPLCSLTEDDYLTPSPCHLPLSPLTCYLVIILSDLKHRGKSSFPCSVFYFLGFLLSMTLPLLYSGFSLPDPEVTNSGSPWYQRTAVPPFSTVTSYLPSWLSLITQSQQLFTLTPKFKHLKCSKP